MSFVDKIAENFRKLVSPYKFGGSEYYEMNVPAAWGTNQYLQSYGQIGWLYACVNARAGAVAKTISRWHLYDGPDHENEILKHELLDLLNYMNPFQTSYQFIYLSQMYKDLVGESFWAINFNRGGKPAELWLAPPTYMQVIPSQETYIAGYRYEKGSYKVDFDVNEIIQIYKPNPANPYRGISPAQALTLDLDSERYAAAYQQKLFFNDATPGMVIEYPAQDMPPAETRRELRMEWDEAHKGFRNRGKTAFLWGGKANSITMSNTDMDFKSLRQYSRDVILGVYGVPGSIIGMTEHANRAVAETANYSFMFNTILPECIDVREALNENLCPLFGEGLYLDFNNPVPEDEAMATTNAVNAYKGGLITRNEGREMLGYDDDAERGDVYFSAPAPVSPFGSGPDGAGEPTDNSSTADNLTNAPAKRKIFNSEADKEAHWRTYVTGAEHFEGAFKSDLNKMFTQQKAEALHKFHANPKKGTKLLDKTAFKTAYKDAARPSMTNAMVAAYKMGQELINPKPHKHQDGGIDPVLNKRSLKWLKTRLGWAAEEIGATLEAELTAALIAGFEKGESMDQIAARIEAQFGPMRADRIARTEIMMSSNMGNIAGFRDAGCEQVEVLDAQDDVCCDDCSDLNGEVFDIDDAEGIVPYHPNCLLPNVEVSAAHVVSGSRAFYRGDAVEITTKNGHVLTCTPNHPILTPLGFIKAESLNEGDYVISSLDSERILHSIDPDNNYAPSLIKDKWDALMMQSGMVNRSMPVATHDFHGDARAFDGNVDIIYPDGLLLSDVSNSFRPEHIGKQVLNSRYVDLQGFDSGSPLGFFGNTMLPSFNGSVRGSGAGLALLDRHERHRSDISLTAIARRDSTVYQAPADNIAAYAELSRKFQLRFSGLIAPDNIVKVRKFNYVGHVYDLQTLDQLYIGNSIVVKNCRCVLLPVIPEGW